MFEDQSVNVASSQSKFEKGIDALYRKDFGVFLTNNINTVDKVLDIVDFDYEVVKNKKFLEPSCGNGVFLIRLLERLFPAGVNKNVVSDFIGSNLYFVDIDKNMIRKTESNLREF